MHKHGLIDSIHASARTRIVAGSASILLVHPYYIHHPTRQPAGTRVCRPQEQFTTPSPALKEKSGNAWPDFRL